MKKIDIKIRVYYEDTDAGGIVYHANYLKFMERARTEWVRALGIEQQKLLEQSIAFVVIDMNIKFKRSALLDDELICSCKLQQMSKASMQFEQQISKQGQVLTTATVKVACVNTALEKPIRIPTVVFDAAKCFA